MAIREILVYPLYKALLRRKSLPVYWDSRYVKQLIRDMKDTLNSCPEGIGLAAPQINVHRRLVVVRFSIGEMGSTQYGPPVAIINPSIHEARDERKDFDGCLSFPNLYGETVRPHCLRISGMDESGDEFERVYVGSDAVVIHHEIDHLDGVLFIDHIERIEDLYRVEKNETGELVRVPIEAELR
jgi:peptide deformylase